MIAPIKIRGIYGVCVNASASFTKQINAYLITLSKPQKVVNASNGLLANRKDYKLLAVCGKDSLDT